MKSARSRKALGDAAEEAAARFLRSQGYTIITRNFSTRSGEVDIIAADGETLCFVEVRSRAGDDTAPPYTSVGRTKQARVRAAASAYVARMRLQNKLCRFDVLSLVPDAGQKSGWEIQLLRDAF